MYPRPPHYVTEIEFENLRLTDDQWNSMRDRLKARDSSASLYSEDDLEELARIRKQEQELDRVVNVGVAALLGMLLLLVAAYLGGMVTGTPMWEIMREPLAFMTATVAAAFLMRKR